MKKLIVLLAFASALLAQNQGGGITQPGAGGLPVYPGTGSPAGVACTAGQAYQYQGTAYLCNGGIFVASTSALPSQPNNTVTGNVSGGTSAPTGLTGAQVVGVIGTNPVTNATNAAQATALAPIATQTIVCNPTGGSASPVPCTPAQSNGVTDASTTARNFAATLTAPVIGGTAEVNSYIAPCTVDGITYTTSFSCAWHSLYDVIVSTGQSWRLHVGAGVWNKESDGEYPHSSNNATIFLVGDGPKVSQIVQTASLNTYAGDYALNNAGTAYTNGDVLTVTQTNCAGGQVQVSSVSSGVITAINLITPGRGTGCAVATGLATTGGTGSGATVNSVGGAPMFRQLPAAGGGSAMPFLMEGLSISTGGNSQGALESDGTINGLLDNVDIRDNTPTNNPSIMLGRFTVANSYGLNFRSRKVYVNAVPYTSSSSYFMAKLTPTVTSGSIASVAVNNGGLFPNNTATIYVWGTTATTDTGCSGTQPVLTPVMTSVSGGFTISSVTVANGGTLCGNVFLQASTVPTQDYIFDFQNISDSQFYDWDITGVAAKGAGRLANHGGITMFRYHPYPASPGIIPDGFDIQNGGSVEFVTPNWDSINHYWVDQQNTGAQLSKILGGSHGWNYGLTDANYPGGSGYHVAFGASGLLMNNTQCGTPQTDGGMNEFVSSGGALTDEQAATYFTPQNDQVCDGTGRWVNSSITTPIYVGLNGSAVGPVVDLFGTPFAGTSSTSWPLMYIHAPGATNPSFNTARTFFGINGDGSSSRVLLGVWNNGSQEFLVNGNGQMFIGSGGILNSSGATSFIPSSTAWTSNKQLIAPLFASTTNCSSAASPAVCAAAAAGSVVIAAAATTVAVNDTAVTANSQIMLTFDASLGTKLGVTCNTTYGAPFVSARIAGTSFTVSTGAVPVTNPNCYSFSIIN